MRHNVVQLYPARSAIGHFIRLGSSPHLLLEESLASGRLGRAGQWALDRVVVDGALVPRQTQLIRALVAGGVELTLETNVAELSSVGRYRGGVRQAPWAIADRPLELSDWDGAQGYERISTIARFAVELGFHRVLAPTHLLTSADDTAFATDRSVFEKLRHALDEHGGSSISIDYPLLLPYSALRDDGIRNGLIAALRDVAFENIWLRISQFGRDASPLGIRRYIDAARDFIDLQRPVVADSVAGFAGLATVAFGAAGALAHGIGVYERFDASKWNKVPKAKQGGGQGARALVSALDRQLTYQQIRMIAAVTGGRTLVTCNDACCRRGLNDMLDDPRTHYIYQRRARLDELSREPATRRADHFIDHMLVPADRRVRRMSRLTLPDPKLSEMLTKESQRLEHVVAVLDNLRADDSDARRSLAPRAISRRLPVREARR